MALSTKVEELIESFNPLFHIYHLPLNQKHENAEYAYPHVAEAEVARLKREARALLDVYGVEVGNPKEAIVSHAFRVVLKRDDFFYRRHYLSAITLWDAEREVLRPNSLAFVP